MYKKLRVVQFPVNLFESKIMAIIGNLYRLEAQYKNVNLKTVFEYLKQTLDSRSKTHKRIFALPVGSFEKVDLKNGIFTYEQVAMTQEIDKCFIESHKNYVDFQMIVEGIEEMGYVDIEKLEVDIPYDERKDLIIYKMRDGVSKFVLEKEDLAVFFPEDGHIGLAQYKEESLIRKAVVKVPLELIRTFN